MTRTLIVLAAAFALAGSGARALRIRDERAVPRQERVQTLSGADRLEPDQIKGLGLYFPRGFEIVYEKIDGAWRMPQYRGAYAEGDRIEAIVRDLTQGLAVEAPKSGRPDSFFGFTEGQTLIMKLYGHDASVKLEVECGRPLPGLWGRDAYVRKKGEDVILHLGGNPLAAVGGAKPPLVDDRIVPGGLGLKGDLARIEVQPPPASGVAWLERRERPKPQKDPNIPLELQALPQYDWFASIDGKEVKLPERSGSAYADYLRRARFSRLPRPNELPESAIRPADPTLVLEFHYEEPVNSGAEEGEASEEAPPAKKEPVVTRLGIQLRGETEDGLAYVYFTGTDLIASMEKQKAGLMFPTARTLVEPMFAGMYEAAEPSGQGGLFGP